MATKEKKSKTSTEVDATRIMKRNDAMKADRQTWDSTIQQIANYVMPRKNQIAVKQMTPDIQQGAELYDDTAGAANLVLGAGQLQYITPASERWAGYEAPEQLRVQNGGLSNKLTDWYQNCTEIAMREIARSNFYTEVHEFYLDRGGLGTACLYAAQGKKEALHISCWAYGSYCIAEDDEGNVDTVYREFKLTVRQAVQKFGIDKVGPKLAKDYNDKAGDCLDKKYTFIHAIEPRVDRDIQKIDGPNKPIASVYVCIEEKKVISNEGYDEMPSMVTRYLTWGDEVWGYCPSVDILSTIRQVNFIERQMDALAEKMAFPPVLIPENMTGLVDMGAAGVTSYDPNEPNALPKEWLTNGKYDVGKDRVEIKREAIKRAYHNDLFQMFAQADRDMTAYEAMQRVAEKLVLFSPTFARLTTEFLNPFLARVFGILFRAGMFPEAPEEAYIQNSAGKSLVLPQVTYTSKVALAIKALQNQSFIEFMNIIGPLVGIRPEALDNLDVDKVFLGIMRNCSIPTTWGVDAKTRDATRAARAQQAQAQAGLAAGESISKSAANLGKAPPGMRSQVADVMAASGRN